VSCSDATAIVEAINGIGAKLTYNDKSLAEILYDILYCINGIEVGGVDIGSIDASLAGILNSITGIGLPPATLHDVISAIDTKMAHLNYIVDNLRDNLDAVVPRGEETAEFGLATLVASFGPTFGRMDKSLQCVSEAMNVECEEPGAPEPPIDLEALLTEAIELINLEGIEPIEDEPPPED